MNIVNISSNANRSIEYAKTLIKNSIEYKFIRHDGLWTSCDFAGYILVTRFIVGSGSKIYIQDADDAYFERSFKNEESSKKVFDEFFSGYPFFDKDMRDLLTMYGFSG